MNIYSELNKACILYQILTVDPAYISARSTMEQNFLVHLSNGKFLHFLNKEGTISSTLNPSYDSQKYESVYFPPLNLRYEYRENNNLACFQNIIEHQTNILLDLMNAALNKTQNISLYDSSFICKDKTFRALSRLSHRIFSELLQNTGRDTKYILINDRFYYDFKQDVEDLSSVLGTQIIVNNQVFTKSHSLFDRYKYILANRYIPYGMMYFTIGDFGKVIVSKELTMKYGVFEEEFNAVIDKEYGIYCCIFEDLLKMSQKKIKRSYNYFTV